MVALDTNVLARLLVNDDMDQQRMAHQRLAALRSCGEDALVCDVVLAELSWVLDAVYGYPREQIHAALSGLLRTAPFHIPRPDSVERALEWYARGAAGFSDCLVLARSREADCHRLLTFDHKLLRYEGCEVP